MSGTTTKHNAVVAGVSAMDRRVVKDLKRGDLDVCLKTAMRFR